jgi:nuclear pore complex protein Nup188
MLVISNFVSTALSEIFEMAKIQTKSWDLDRDMELLITVFEQCTRPELYTSPRLWLERIQELDLARSSLELLIKCDLGGSTMDGATLRTHRHPPYARHILALQLCLSSTGAPAEALALAGAISAYSNISIANELTVGTLDPLHPELPGERNPGQQAWCTILNIVSGLVGTVGKSSGHFVETEITSFVQLYGAELSKALEWNVGQPLSSGALEEMEAIIGLFYTMSLCVNPRSAADVQSLMILSTFAEKSLILLQHLNYALSHPNLLASIFEPTTSEERRALDKEINSSMEMSSATELLDPDKRPFISSLTQRMHVIVRDILSTLVIVNRGDEVIVQEPDDWPNTVQIAPVSTRYFHLLVF